MRTLLVAGAVWLSLMTAGAHAADETTGPVSVLRLQCAADGYCTAFFPEGTIPRHTCTRQTGDAVRWQVTLPAGPAQLSLMQSAKLSGIKVKISVDGCIGEYPQLHFVQLIR